MATPVNKFYRLIFKSSFNFRKNCSYFFLILLGVILNSCVEENKVVNRRLLFAEYTAIPKDTVVIRGEDTAIFRKYFNLYYALNIEEKGQSTLIFKQHYDDTLVSSQIKISDSLVNHLFALVNDDELLENKKAPHDSDIDGVIYCGGSHLIVFTDSLGKERHIRFIPPLANKKLHAFDELLRSIVNEPSIIGKSPIKPTAFDSIIMNKAALYFKYDCFPTLKQVKFTPPVVGPYDQELENTPD